ncbi:MAG: DUF2125 domain-containing protein [Silicimonas sp.]|nr:DUF2125 domain-containing protein [Silicimonas sp.]
MGYRNLVIAGAVALTATPCLADLTAEEVLADHLNLLSGYGLIEMTSTGTTKTGTGLSVTGLTGTYADDETAIEVRYTGFELVEQDDGSVRTIYPDIIPITFHTEPVNEPAVEVTVMLATSGLNHVVSGSPDDLTHAISFEKAWLHSVEVSPPEAAAELDLDHTFEMENAATTIHFDERDTPKRDVSFQLGLLNMVMKAVAPTDISVQNSESSYSASGLGDMDMVIRLEGAGGSVSYEATEVPRHGLDLTLKGFLVDQTSVLPDDEGDMQLRMSASDLTLEYDIAISIEAMEQDMLAALAAGQGVTGGYSVSALDYVFGIDTPDDGAFSGSSSNGATDGRFSFDRNGASYTGSSMDSVAEIEGNIPEFPLSSLGYSVDAATFDMHIPLVPSEEEQPLRLAFAMEGVQIADALWNLFDPAEALPRDPLNLSFDLEGTTIVARNPFGEDESVPFQQTKAQLNQLRLSVAGAELTGDGSVIDTSTSDTPSGIGELNLMLTGGNTLLDTLVAMGLLPDEQAMGARMMLGLIARPGEGADTLISKIEVKEDGSILANGQRIK